MTQIIGAGSKLLIQQVVEETGISRPTIQKALKAGDLSGEQDPETRRWYIEPSEAQRWASTKKRRRLAVTFASVPDTVPDQSELVSAMKDQVRQLQAQIEVKDEQIGRAQSTIDKQTLLLEHQQATAETELMKKELEQLNDQLKAQDLRASEQVKKLEEQLQEQKNRGFFQRLFKG